jgi:hypothetical protein
MERVSIFVSLLFVLATFFTAWQFFKASGKSKSVLILLILYMLIQAVLGLSGFYQKLNTVPPRFIFLIGPGLLLTLVLFLTKNGKKFLASLDIKELTLLHAVRVPVEVTLYYLFLAKLIPEIMTFEGYNYDILSGISAVVVYFGLRVANKVNDKLLLLWNFLCLGLLLNIVIIAILSVPAPFQKLAFEQPNIGISFFPFIWLPSIIVPLVFLSHLAGIRQLLIQRGKNK